MFLSFISVHSKHVCMVNCLVYVCHAVVISYISDVECQASDYKDWTPLHHLYGSQNCLLGQRLVYERRRAHAFCYNGRNYDRKVSATNCSCTVDDYEW